MENALTLIVIVLLFVIIIMLFVIIIVWRNPTGKLPIQPKPEPNPKPTPEPNPKPTPVSRETLPVPLPEDPSITNEQALAIFSDSIRDIEESRKKGWE